MPRNKKVIIENNVLIGGGVEIILHSLATYLSKGNYSVLICTPEGAYKQFKKIYTKGVKYHSPIAPLVNAKKYSLRWFMQKTQRRIHWFNDLIIDRTNFDIAIAMKEGESVKKISSRRAKKKFAWIHINYRDLYYTKRIFGSAENEKQYLSEYRRVICVSNAVANGIKETIGDPENLTVCYNPINHLEIYKKANENCQLEKPKDRILFVAVGRLAQEKRFEMLIEACVELSSEYLFEVWIIGDGPLRKEIEEKIQSCNLKCVKLLGQKDNPYPYMKMSDYFISTSRTESYGLALQEALILGVPVIATECAAIRETIDEQFGIIVENSISGVINGMRRVLTNPDMSLQYRNAISSAYNTEELWEPRLVQIENVLNG